MEPVKRVAESIDRKRDLLLLIKVIDRSFYNEFVREFLTDPLTYENFERDLIKALDAIKGIRIATQDPRENNDNSVLLMYADVIIEFDSYEDAISQGIKLLLNEQTV